MSPVVESVLVAESVHFDGGIQPGAAAAAAARGEVVLTSGGQSGAPVHLRL